MLQWRKDAMPVQVASHMVADDMFKHLACYARQADRAVIFCLAGGTLLEDGWDECCLPGRWQCASLYSDWVNMAANTGAKVAESSFSMRQGTWPGPTALLGFIPVRSFSTPWILISSLSIGGYLGPDRTVSLPSLSTENTDVNCLFSISAFFCPPVCSFPSSFNAATLPRSFLWLKM